MYGQHVGALNIISKTVQRGERKIWSVMGDKGDRWMYGQVEVELSHTTQVLRVGLLTDIM